MSIPSAEELTRGRQPIQTSKLVRWAEQAGFSLRRSGGGTSHIVCHHSLYPDIMFKIIADSDKTGSQRDLAKALIALERRRNAEHASSPETAADVGRTDRLRLPAHIRAHAVSDRGPILLRDQQLPSIGIALADHEIPLAENKVRYLESLKRDAYMLVNRAGLEIGRPDCDGGQRFTHPVYGGIRPVSVPAYQPGDPPAGLLATLGEISEKVLMRDNDHRVRLADVLSHSFIQATSVTYSSRRGERSNHIHYQSPSGKNLTMEFTSYSNARAGAYNDVFNARISEATISSLEERVDGIARAYENKSRLQPAPVGTADYSQPFFLK